MINRDYILRMIEQLSRFLQRALMMKDAKEYHESVAEIKKAGKMFLGLNPEAMDGLSDRDLVRLWSVGNDLDAEKCALAAQIFRAEGEIYEDQGNEEKAVGSYVKSLSLLVETINFLKEKIPVELIASVEFLTHHIDVSTLPLALQQKVFRAYATVGRFAKAEDLLFDVIDQDASFVNEGKRFYEQLLRHTDEELERGNLPRAEILESLAQLNNKTRETRDAKNHQ
jgi:tetratricopeptide (TPR) repeat protein